MTVPVSVGLDLAIASTFVVVALLAFRHRRQPGAVPFVLLAVLLAALTLGVGVSRFDAVSEAWTPYLLFVPYVFASLAWLALAFEYTGRGPVVTKRRAVALVAFGVAVIVVTALNVVVPDSIRPAWLLLINVSQVGLLTAASYGAFLVARSAISYHDLPRSGSLALTTAGGGLVLVTLVTILTPTIPYRTAADVIRAILAAIAALLLLTQVRYRVFETGPSAGHLARETVLDEMSASVAITDRQNRLLDFNRTAERTFDIDQSDALGAPIGDVLDADFDSHGAQPVAVETDGGRRQFELDRAQLTSRGGDPVGRAYIFRDVTERRARQQRLDVLNRVLRHNLRNDLDAIRGFAEALDADEPQVDRVALAAQIQETATDLADLGATLSQADRLLEDGDLDTELVDVGELVRRTVATVGETYPDAEITVSSSAPARAVETDPGVLETVLEEAIENAIEHNDSETPLVEIDVVRRESSVVIEVRDDGPGIPEQERSVLLHGKETPLRHGSGLGLWLVYWGVTRLGGDLEFREHEPRGSTVSIRLPVP